MKIAGRTFSAEEFLFCFTLAIFFLVIFVGAWDFNADSAVFPILISLPALILVALYALQGYLPRSVQRAISSNDRFAFGKMSETIESGKTKFTDDVRGVYFILFFTGAFTLLAWAIGFYIAAVVAVAAYLMKTRSEIDRIRLVAVILVVLALGTIYMFDSAFGHHYGNGALMDFR